MANKADIAAGPATGPVAADPRFAPAVPRPVPAPAQASVSGLAQTNADGSTVSLSQSQVVNDDLLADVLRRLQDPDQSIMPVEEVSPDGLGLQKLMKRGAWKSVLRLSSTLISTAKYPHHKLRYRLARIVGMTKMRMLTNAFNEFVDIGKIDDPRNLYETYPDLYPSKKGSMVPFSLRHLYAEIFYALGRDPSMEYLHTLRQYCLNKATETAAANPGNSLSSSGSKPSLTPAEVDGLHADPLLANSPTINHNVFPEEYDENLPETWLEREQRVIFSIVTKRVLVKEFVPALQLFNSLLERYPTDPVLLSCYGRILLTAGATKFAEAAFSKAEKSPELAQYPTLAHMNRGLYSIATDQLNLATDSFRSVLDACPSHSVASNNLALCHLHHGDVTKAIEMLEESIFSDPGNMQEPVVGNLVSLYDLSSEKPLDKRKKIIQLIKDHARDDFNIACLKLPGQPPSQ